MVLGLLVGCGGGVVREFEEDCGCDADELCVEFNGIRACDDVPSTCGSELATTCERPLSSDECIADVCDDTITVTTDCAVSEGVALRVVRCEG